MEGLGVGDNEAVLLLFVAVKKEERAHASRFPEVMFADVTMQTNNERRPLFVLSGKDANNKAFTILRAFLPSQRLWVFDWLWNNGIPRLLRPTAGALPILPRRQLCMMDNDDKERSPFEDGMMKFYIDAMAGCCGWHINDRGQKSHPPGPTKTNGETAQAVKEAVNNTIYSWMGEGGVESEEEYDLSREILYSQLDSNDVHEVMGKSWCQNMKDFIHCYVHPYRKYFLFYRYMDKRSFGAYTTSVSESINSSIKATKKNPGGVRPNQPMHESYGQMSDQADAQAIERNRKAAADLDTVPTWSKSPTAPQITAYGETILMEQYQERNNYYLHRQDENAWLLMRKQGKKKPSLSELSVTKFKRVRKVELIGEHLECSCRFYSRYGIPCRHILAINGLPSVEDIAVRWHRQYGYFYGRDGYEEVTELYNEAMNAAPKGPRIGVHAKAELPKVDEETLQEITNVMNSPVPALLPPWNAMSIDLATSTEKGTDGERKYLISREGGMQTLVSICRDSKEEMQTKTKGSQYRINQPTFVDGCTYAEMCPEAARFWKEALKKASTDTLRIAQENGKKRKPESNSSSAKSGSTAPFPMVSSMPEGSDKASMGTREMPAGEYKRSRRH